ncbi:uncharacterized protein LOC135492149 [Lineus longissimus]|uniref:uncharacterized protein LOC135492149 n=1 Tax=Lineus longissimus TaxID=88925 RepID=UPI002B4D2170
MASTTATAQEAAEFLEDKALAEEDLLDEDDVPAHILEARFNELKQRAEAFKQFQEKGHGHYTTIDEEKKFLHLTTSESRCVVHFFHTDFRRCAIVDTHLKKLAEKHFETKFAKIDVKVAKFFVEKLKIKELPAILCFVDAKVKDKIIGFSDLGNTDSFSTEMLERRLGKSEVITVEDVDEEEERRKKTIYGFKKNRGANDDSSDDDDY